MTVINNKSLNNWLSCLFADTEFLAFTQEVREEIQSKARVQTKFVKLDSGNYCVPQGNMRLLPAYDITPSFLKAVDIDPLNYGSLFLTNCINHNTTAIEKMASYISRGVLRFCNANAKIYPSFELDISWEILKTWAEDVAPKLK